MNPLILLKALGSLLGAYKTFLKGNPFPWLLAGLLGLYGAFQWHSSSNQVKLLEKARWELLSLQSSYKAAVARADQATEALKASRSSLESLRASHDKLRGEVSTLRSQRAQRASKGVLEACQRSHDILRESLYK